MKVMLVVVVLLLSVGTASSQTKPTSIPNTHAGKRLADWLVVFASGDQDSFTRFVTEHYAKSLLAETSAVDRADRYARTYLDTRGFIVHDIEKSADQEITVLAQASLTGFQRQ
jgi:hypothetical protein